MAIFSMVLVITFQFVQNIFTFHVEIFSFYNIFIKWESKVVFAINLP